MPLSFTEKKRIRYSFGKIGKTIEVPNLVDIQKISYDKFLQLGKSVENRSNTGLQEVFNSVFPIKDYAGKSELHYIDYYLDNPKYDVDECRRKGLTFSASLMVTFRLIIWDINEETEEKSLRDIKEQVVTINGLSKGFAMTGWRFGYLGAPKEIAAACVKMQGQITSATCSITQRAAITALSASPKCTYEMRNKFKFRRDLIIKLLSEIEKLKINTPEGAFYIFPDISRYIGTSYMNYKILNATDLAMFLLEDCGVATVSGSAFGAEKHLRISYAAAEEELKKACTLIKNSLNKLQ